jgi:hypothetical protein
MTTSALRAFGPRERFYAKVHAYCRNKAKFIHKLPEVVDNKNVEGSIYDVDLFTNGIRGCRAVFLAITTNDNIAGGHLSQDLVKTVIHALRRSCRNQVHI